MSKYKSGMDKIYVNDEMRSRILDKLASTSSERPSSFRLRWRAAIPVCIIMVFVAVLVTLNPGIPDTSVTDPGVQAIPQIETADSVEGLATMLDFAFYAPSVLPQGYEADQFAFLHSKIAQIVYLRDEARITYRTAKFTGDSISGIYEVYETVSVDDISGTAVTLSKKGTDIFLAEWNDADLSFCLFFENGVDRGTCAGIIEHMTLVQ